MTVPSPGTQMRAFSRLGSLRFGPVLCGSRDEIPIRALGADS